MDAMKLIEAALAAPKTHRVTTLYADGTTKTHDARSEFAAKNYAVGERRKVGKDLISRETGKKVRVVSITVSKIDA